MNPLWPQSKNGYGRLLIGDALRYGGTGFHLYAEARIRVIVTWGGHCPPFGVLLVHCKAQARRLCHQYFTKLCFLTLFAFFPFPLFPLIFLTPFPGLFAAEFPDDAALAEFAVEAGVGAGPAIIQALLAVGDLHFLADDAGVPVRVVAAFIHE